MGSLLRSRRCPRAAGGAPPSLSNVGRSARTRPDPSGRTPAAPAAGPDPSRARRSHRWPRRPTGEGLPAVAQSKTPVGSLIVLRRGGGIPIQDDLGGKAPEGAPWFTGSRGLRLSQAFQRLRRARSRLALRPSGWLRCRTGDLLVPAITPSHSWRRRAAVAPADGSRRSRRAGCGMDPGPASHSLTTFRHRTPWYTSALGPSTLWCRGLARHPFKVKIEGSNPSRVALSTPLRSPLNAGGDQPPARLAGDAKMRD